MKRALIVDSIIRLNRRIDYCKSSKKRLFDYVQEIKNKCLNKEITYSEYDNLINQKRKGKTIQEWLDFYDSYIKQCEEKIRGGRKKLLTRRVLFIFLSFSLISMLIFGGFYLRPIIIGLTVEEAPTEAPVEEVPVAEIPEVEEVPEEEAPEEVPAEEVPAELPEEEVPAELPEEEVPVEEEVPENITEEIPVNITEEVPEEEIPKEIPVNITPEIPVNITPEIPVNITPEIPVNITLPENITITEKITEINATITTTQQQAKIGEPVKWKKYIELEKPGEVKIKLPKEAENITVKKIREAGEVAEKETKAKEEAEEISSDTQQILEELKQIKEKLEKVEKELKEIKEKIPEEKPEETEEAGTSPITGNAIFSIKKSKIEKISFFRWLFSLPKMLFSTITGRAITTEETGEEIELTINDTAVEYEVEYETPAPTSTEEITARGKTITITGPETLHYENILAFTNLPKEVSKEKIKLYRTTGGIREPVEFISKDNNNNSLIDYIEWLVPELSEETYELVIEISKAEHLDENRIFISDIYEQVKSLDDIWSETINNNEYIRVTFEQSLDNTKDITLYPRITSGNPKIEVYEYEGTELIAEFTELKENEYNKVLLTNLQGSQDVFDLKVTGGDIELEHIIDPPYQKLTITGVTQLCGEVTIYNKIVVASTGTLLICAFNATKGTGYVNISLGANGNFTLQSGGKIEGARKGGRGGSGCSSSGCTATRGDNGNNWTIGTSANRANGGGGGAGTRKAVGDSAGGAGGAFGGNGGGGSYSTAGVLGAAGIAYGTSADQKLKGGSGGAGGAGDSAFAGGAGGAGIKINVGSGVINIQGIINVSGNNGTSTSAAEDMGAGGGGSGGHVILIARTLNLNNGKIYAQGASGGIGAASQTDTCGGGGGGGGRIVYVYGNISQTGLINKTSAGAAGANGDATCTGPGAGSAGTVYYNSTTFLDLDTIFPKISIVYPTNTIYNVNVTELTYVVSDNIALHACWYSLNNGITNTTIACGTNATGLISNEGTNTWIISTEDTSANTNSSSVTFTKDTTYPVFSGYWDDNATLLVSGTAHFNVSIASTNTTVFLEIGGSNYTASPYNRSATKTYVPNSTASKAWKGLDADLPPSSVGDLKDTAYSVIELNKTSYDDNGSVSITGDGTNYPGNQFLLHIAESSASINNISIRLATFGNDASVTSNLYGYNHTKGSFLAMDSEDCSFMGVGIRCNLTYVIKDPANFVNASGDLYIATQLAAAIPPRDSIIYYIEAVVNYEQSSFYNVSVSMASAGTFSYYWGSWGNGVLHNYNVSALRYYTVNASGNQAPSIIKVFNNSFSPVTLNSGSHINLTLNFTAYDGNGVSDLDNSTAMANFTKSGEATRANSTCLQIKAAGNYANYSCNIMMWWWDDDGVWDITAYIKDSLAVVAQNKTTILTVNPLTSFDLGPAILPWGTINPGSTNQTPTSQAPIALNNTGNQDILSGSIQVNATSLMGETTTTQGLYSGNFTVSNTTSKGAPNLECNTKNITAIRMSDVSGANFMTINASRVNANLSRGNYTKADGTAQEKLYFCLTKAGSEISSQSYSTSLKGSWTIRISIIFIFTYQISNSKSKKKKKQKLNRKKKQLKKDNLITSLNLIIKELRENYSPEKEKITKLLVKEIKKKYKLNYREISKLIETRKKIEIPLNIFPAKLGALEALTKYLKENLNMSYREIGKLINRNERTIWTAYNKAKKKQPEPIKIKETEISLPIKIFNKEFTILESIILYLKQKKMRYSEIAELLSRDQRNIFTVYSRAVKKLNGKV